MAMQRSRSSSGESNHGRGDGGHQGGDGGHSERETKRADPCVCPYHFVPVPSANDPPKEAEGGFLDRPVFHDVQETGDDFWTGELRCTLRALTPLIAANFQYEYRYLKEDLRRAFESLLRVWEMRDDVSEAKKIIEPLFTERTDDGCPERVLIPGEAIKGAIRHSFSALLAAPMERVEERTFSFQPCLNNAESVCPAVVVRQLLKADELEIAYVGETCASVVYVDPKAEATLKTLLVKNGWIDKDGGLDSLPPRCPRADIDSVVTDVSIRGSRWTSKLVVDVGATCNLSGYVLLRYRGGLDGSSTFSDAYPEQQTSYRWCLVKWPFAVAKSIPSGGTRKLGKDVLDDYRDLLRHVADRKKGHLRSHPLKELNVTRVEENIKGLLDNGPQVGDLIFVERRGNRIIGIGHHYRFRRRYRDTIHFAYDPASTRAKHLRSVLCPRPLERPSQKEEDRTAQPGLSRAGAPQRLSAARGLFGYVAEKRASDDDSSAKKLLTFGIGDGDFSQLAGRVSINWAVEDVKADKPRFLNEECEYLVPLRPLGEPKASAVETYLTQDRLGTRKDRGTLCTYGDHREDNAAGKLRGRKFYLHQPLAADESEQHFELKLGGRDWCVRHKESTTYPILGDKAVIARFVSQRETEFKFTIRLRDVRSWELGALLFVLTADETLIGTLLDDLCSSDKRPAGLGRWLRHVRTWRDKHPLKSDLDPPLLAMRIGHGRPLGLGSAKISVDSIVRVRFDKQVYPMMDPPVAGDGVCAVRQETISALAEKLKGEFGPGGALVWAQEVLLPWLQVHRFVGRRKYDYPRGRDGTSARDPIYEYHSEQRKRHAGGRKEMKDGKEDSLSAGGLVSLDDLDKDDLNPRRGS